jgi:hypothetical protein
MRRNHEQEQQNITSWRHRDDKEQKKTHKLQLTSNYYWYFTNSKTENTWIHPEVPLDIHGFFRSKTDEITAWISYCHPKKMPAKHSVNQYKWPYLHGYPVHVRSSWHKRIFFRQTFYGQTCSTRRETSGSTHDKHIFRKFLLECTNDPASSKIDHYFPDNFFQQQAIEIFPGVKPPNFPPCIEWRKNELSIYQNGDRSLSILKKTRSSKRYWWVPC